MVLFLLGAAAPRPVRFKSEAPKLAEKPSQCIEPTYWLPENGSLLISLPACRPISAPTLSARKSPHSRDRPKLGWMSSIPAAKRIAKQNTGIDIGRARRALGKVKAANATRW